MNRDQKAAVIDEIAADITDAQAIFAVDYRGITVAQADELRARLRDGRRELPRRQELADRARRRRRPAPSALKPLLEGPDGADVRPRRRRGGRQGGRRLRAHDAAARLQGRPDGRRGAVARPTSPRSRACPRARSSTASSSGSSRARSPDSPAR